MVVSKVDWEAVAASGSSVVPSLEELPLASELALSSLEELSLVVETVPEVEVPLSFPSA